MGPSGWTQRHQIEARCACACVPIWVVAKSQRCRLPPSSSPSTPTHTSKHFLSTFSPPQESNSRRIYLHAILSCQRSIFCMIAIIIVMTEERVFSTSCLLNDEEGRTHSEVGKKWWGDFFGKQGGNQAFLEYFHNRCALGKIVWAGLLTYSSVSSLGGKKSGTKRGKTTAA